MEWILAIKTGSFLFVLGSLLFITFHLVILVTGGKRKYFIFWASLLSIFFSALFEAYGQIFSPFDEPHFYIVYLRLFAILFFFAFFVREKIIEEEMKEKEG